MILNIFFVCVNEHIHLGHALLQVPLGVILKNENLLNEMVEILDELHKYVPMKQTTQEFDLVHQYDEVEHVSVKVYHFHHILLGSDQLTVARVRGCQRIRNNSDNGRACLEGLFPVVEDWHTKMCYLKVSIFLCVTVVLLCVMYYCYCVHIPIYYWQCLYVH